MGTRIERLLLTKNGGNQSEMARFVGVSPQAVQKWIAGESEPRGDNLVLAAEFLNVSPAELKFGMQFNEPPAQFNAPKEAALPEHIQAVVDLMKTTDDRGMRTIRLAAEQALDDYRLLKNKLESSLGSEEESELLRMYRAADKEKKELLLMSATAVLVDSSKKTDGELHQVIKNAG